MYVLSKKKTKRAKMDSKKRKQNPSTSSETAGPKKKKEEKLSKSQVIASHSLSKMDLLEAMKKQNDASMVLTGQVIATIAKNSNFIFSPASLNAVITMLTPGSDEHNAVFNEIATVVFADCGTSGGPKISWINGVWVEQSLPVDHSLKDLMENVFKATFTQVDFRFKGEQLRKELNKLVSDHTNGLITNFLPPGSVSRDTEEIYGNALYFKGAWKDKFDKSLTKHKDFHLVNGKQVHVPFMKSYKRQYVEAYSGFKVLRLPYRQVDDDTSRRFSMCFFLPDMKDGLDNLVKEMTSTPGFLDSHIPKELVEVGDLGIPKFKISFRFSASKLEGPRKLKFVYHKACVEIDEEGAEAVAATIGGRRGRREAYTPPKTIDFVADHPFLFLIREDKTGTILFAGQIFNPK